MKKWLAIIVAVMMAMTAFTALAEGEEATPTLPKTIEEFGDLATVSLDDFATMTTKTKDGETTVTLSKAVDSLQANWMGEGEEPEDMTVGDDLTATVTVSGRKQQLGTSESGGWQAGDYYFIWEDDHDYYYSYNDDPETVAAGIKAVYDYMKSGEFEKTEEATEFLEEHPNAKADVLERKPDARVQAYAEVEYTWTDEETGETYTYTDWDVIDSVVLDASATDEELQAAYDEMAAKYADDSNVNVDSWRNSGYAWGRLIETLNEGLLGAPNHAFVAKQAGCTVIYGRDGKVMQVSKDIENADFFGVGTGTAHLLYQKTNAGWRLASVTMEYPEGSKVSAIRADYNGNGELCGSAIK